MYPLYKYYMLTKRYIYLIPKLHIYIVPLWVFFFFWNNSIASFTYLFGVSSLDYNLLSFSILIWGNPLKSLPQNFSVTVYLLNWFVSNADVWINCFFSFENNKSYHTGWTSQDGFGFVIATVNMWILLLVTDANGSKNVSLGISGRKWNFFEDNAASCRSYGLPY
jgi:hypothetical protein